MDNYNKRCFQINWYSLWTGRHCFRLVALCFQWTSSGLQCSHSKLRHCFISIVCNCKVFYAVEYLRMVGQTANAEGPVPTRRFVENSRNIQGCQDRNRRLGSLSKTTFSSWLKLSRLTNLFSFLMAPSHIIFKRDSAKLFRQSCRRKGDMSSS